VGGKPPDLTCEPVDVDRGEVVFRRPVAELAEVVVAPALDSLRTRERTCVAEAGCDCNHSAGEPGDVDRCVTVGSRSITKRAGEVVPPTFDATGTGQGTAVQAAHGDCGHPAR